jgi:hypothetical protein
MAVLAVVKASLMNICFYYLLIASPRDGVRAGAGAAGVGFYYLLIASFLGTFRTRRASFTARAVSTIS